MVHLPFGDRLEAGRLLARELSLRNLASGAVVVGLTRGGVPVGFAVADRLHLPLDALVVRKLGVPWQQELAMGAITAAAQILDEPMIRHLGISREEVGAVIEREQAEMRRREDLYRGGRAPLDVSAKTVILIDDGLATGSSMSAAVRHMRKLEPGGVVVAVPVGSKEACNRLRKEADDLVCLAIPDLFCAVGEWYRDFEQVSDATVQGMLAQSRQQFQKHRTSRAIA
jgi:putative phosphoribosyl transferase